MASGAFFAHKSAWISRFSRDRLWLFCIGFHLSLAFRVRLISGHTSGQDALVDIKRSAGGPSFFDANAAVDVCGRACFKILWRKVLPLSLHSQIDSRLTL